MGRASLSAGAVPDERSQSLGGPLTEPRGPVHDLCHHARQRAAHPRVRQLRRPQRRRQGRDGGVEGATGAR